MGYSIATPIKSEKAKDAMMVFLNRNFDPLGETFKQGPVDRGLGYDHGRCRIGFDGTMISDYMIGLCAWMALKVGKRKCYPTKKNPKVNGPYKYIVYDGIEDWPLYICQRYRTDLKHLVQINWVGALSPKPRAFWNLFNPHPPHQIEDELKRLNALWMLQEHYPPTT